MPDSFSVSQLNTWLGCPRKYRFRYIDKRAPESKSVNLPFGTAVHSAIAWWQEERIAGRVPELDHALRIFRADWNAALADPLLDLEDKSPDELSTLGEALVRLFVDRFQMETPPTAVEQRFEVALRDPETGDTLPIPLVGYFDRQGEGFVGEMKTAARKTGWSEWLLQLSAYRCAVRETTGFAPKMVVIQLIKTKTPQIEVVEASLTDRDEAWFVEVAVEVLRAIAAGAFPPNPSWMCPKCEYRRACRG